MQAAPAEHSSGHAPTAEQQSACATAASTGAVAGADAGTGVTSGGAAEASTTDNRPSDEQIVSHENQIKDEQRARPLLGDKQELSTLRAEYESGSATFVAKINSLTKQYAQFRRTRQDGNCFYRAFLFGLLEALLTSRNAAGAQKLAAVVSGWKEKLIATGYQELVFEDALDLFLDLLKQVSDTQDVMTVGELLTRLCDETASNLVIMFIRLVTSAEVQRRADFFMPFILGMTDFPMEIEDFCRRYVECMGEESDHIQLVATADAFQVPIRVVYLDNSGAAPADSAAELPCDTHDFVPSGDGAEAAGMPRVVALYRPGHYDILYES